jgi:hypothetical protein
VIFDTAWCPNGNGSAKLLESKGKSNLGGCTEVAEV